MRVLLALLLMLFPATVSAQMVEPGDLRLELSFEERSGPLYRGEMVLLKVRGFYKIRIAREKLIQSSLDGFDWMQLGEDKWSKDTSRGGEILQIERIIALFPNRVGTIEIEPFYHELELWTQNGKRFDHTFRSDTISIDVAERPESEDWWLPARRISVSDRWSNAPDKLGTGEGALRVISITAEGVLPEQLPSMPELESAGALVFPHPEVRETRLYRSGPVTRVFWRWTVRPENPPSAYLKPIRIPYFDTKAREHREIVVAAQRIAMTEEAVAAYLAEAADESIAAMAEETLTSVGAAESVRGAGVVVPLALLSGFFFGLVGLMPNLQWHRRKNLGEIFRRFRPDPDVSVLKHAARIGDAAAVRASIVSLIDRGCGDLTLMRSALLELDRHVFGYPDKRADLKLIGKAAQQALRSKQGSARRE